MTELIAEQRCRQANFQKVLRVGLFVDSLVKRWFTLDASWEETASEKELISELRRYRQNQLQLREQAVTLSSQYAEIQESFDQATLARTCLAVGREVPEPHTRKLKTIDDVEVWLKDLNARSRKIEAAMKPYETVTGQRIHCALRLAIWRGVDSSDIRKYWDALQTVKSAAVSMREFERRMQQIEWTSENASTIDQEMCSELLKTLRQASIDSFQDIYGIVGTIQYPFDRIHPVEHASIALLPHFTDYEDIWSCYQDFERYRTGFWSLWRRLQGCIGAIAEDAEVRAGLEPLIDADEQIQHSP